MFTSMAIKIDGPQIQERSRARGLTFLKNLEFSHYCSRMGHVWHQCMSWDFFQRKSVLMNSKKLIQYLAAPLEPKTRSLSPLRLGSPMFERKSKDTSKDHRGATQNMTPSQDWLTNIKNKVVVGDMSTIREGGFTSLLSNFFFRWLIWPKSALSPLM